MLGEHKLPPLCLTSTESDLGFDFWDLGFPH